VGPRALSAGTLEKGLVLSSDLRENPLILDSLAPASSPDERSEIRDARDHKTRDVAIAGKRAYGDIPATRYERDSLRTSVSHLRTLPEPYRISTVSTVLRIIP
jgi:hypothetical protein